MTEKMTTLCNMVEDDLKQGMPLSAIAKKHNKTENYLQHVLYQFGIVSYRYARPKWNRELVHACGILKDAWPKCLGQGCYHRAVCEACAHNGRAA